jgi:hypothetical protein
MSENFTAKKKLISFDAHDFPIIETVINIYRDKFIVSATIATIVLVGLSFLLLFFSLDRLPYQVPLFYSLPWGDRQIVQRELLAILPFFSIVSYFISVILSLILSKEEGLFSRILYFTSFVFTLLSIITLFRIVLLFL